MPRIPLLSRLTERAAGRRAALALCAALLALAVPPALGLHRLAHLAPAPHVQDEDEAAVPPEEVFDSPRAIARAIYGFYEWQWGENPGGLDRAARIFDLSDQPEDARLSIGRHLMEKRLAAIIDRLTLLDSEGSGFPDAGELDGALTWTWTESPPSKPELAIELDFAHLGDAGWKIDRDTVARLPALYAQLLPLPRVSGLEDKPVSMSELVRRWAPDDLEGGGFLIEPYQWLGLLVLILLGVVLDRIARLFLRPLIDRLGRRGEHVDRELLASFERPVGAVITMAVFMALLPALDVQERYHAVLDVAASLVLAVAGVWAAYRLVDVFCWYLGQRASATDNRLDDMMVPLVRRTLKIFVVAVGLLYVASKMSGDLWSIVAGLSLGSIALGFAAKDSVENLFGTFTVLLDRPFTMGDSISVSGMTGTVEQVGFRSTRLRTADDTLITVPNSKFISSNIENNSERRKRRVNTSLGLCYDTPPEKTEAFCEGVRELIRRHPWTRKDSFHVWLTGYGPSSLDVTLVYYLDTTHYATFLREQHRMNLDILRLSEQLGVGFAFPTQTVHLAKPEDLQHEDVPADQGAALEGGRRLGGELAETSLAPFGDARPPLVRFDSADPAAAGPGGPAPSESE